MKIIQQNEKVIACIGKDDTNERKIMEKIESVQENGVTDFEVDSENPMLYSEDGLLYGKKKTMPNGKARLTLIAVPPDKKRDCGSCSRYRNDCRRCVCIQ